MVAFKENRVVLDWGCKQLRVAFNLPKPYSDFLPFKLDSCVIASLMSYKNQNAKKSVKIAL